MRTLDGEGVLVRVFIGESDQWHHRPLFLAVLDFLRREGVAGATVLRGLAGYGARGQVHTATLVELASELPIVIIFVDRADRVAVAVGFDDERAVPSDVDEVAILVQQWDAGGDGNRGYEQVVEADGDARAAQPEAELGRGVPVSPLDGVAA